MGRCFSFFMMTVVVVDLALSAEPAGPPASLDQFYPPKAQGPVYLFKMLDMNSSVSGIAVNLFEGDFNNISRYFDEFQRKYTELSKLVPEWQSVWDAKSVADLGTALKSGDQGKVMEAFGRVGASCHACHTANMASVQHKYHWQDFSRIQVSDPVSKETVSFSGLMQYLALSFEGISTDLKEGQPDRALQHHTEFAHRFQTMKETCNVCHDSERKFYVDESVQAMISQMGTLLKSGTGDPAAMERLGQGIGMESCHKCHLVHVPAAMSQAKFKTGGQ